MEQIKTTIEVVWIVVASLWIYYAIKLTSIRKKLIDIENKINENNNN